MPSKPKPGRSVVFTATTTTRRSASGCRRPEPSTTKGFRFAVTHRVSGGSTELTLFGRERDADAVIYGHSHNPDVDTGGELPLINPGSHAQPRGYRKAHAELEPSEEGLTGRLVTPNDYVIDEFTLSD